MNLKIEYYFSTDIGLKRKNNQDAILINKSLNMFSLADGLGGHLGGEVASSLALQIIDEYLLKNNLNSPVKNPSQLIKQAIQKASAEVFNQSQNHIELEGMATTVSMMWIVNNHVYIGNVGDSRAYLYREGHLWQLTSDHTTGTYESLRGFDIQDQARNQHGSALLTQSVGFTSRVNPEILRRDIVEKDIYLLCSDGLHSMICEGDILNILNSERLNNIPKICTMEALSAGGWDNVSVIALKVVSK